MGQVAANYCKRDAGIQFGCLVDQLLQKFAGRTSFFFGIRIQAQSLSVP
jgi:hypothetical protein